MSAGAMHATARPAITFKDVGLVGKWVAAWLLALVLPVRAWDRASGQAVGLASRLVPEMLTRAEADLGRFLAGQPVEAPIAVLARRYAGHPRTDQLAVMRCYTPWGWRPTLDVVGLEHIETARAEGKGCLLWITPTAFGAVMSKRSLAAAGLALHHLSREGHGAASRSRLGLRLLTLPRTRLEDRYLAERIRIPSDGVSRAAMRRMVELLRAGEVVTVTLGANADRRHRAAFLSSAIEVSLGVPELARQGRAVLLPVVTVRLAPDRFKTIILPPLHLDPAADRDTAGRHAVEELARRLEPHALAWPDQISWNFDLFSRRPHRA
jgi:lauroyl/myristoyl acyltransferase